MNTATTASTGISGTSGTQVNPNGKAGEHFANQGNDMGNAHQDLLHQQNVAAQGDPVKTMGSPLAGSQLSGSPTTGPLSNGLQPGITNKATEAHKPGESNKTGQDNKSANGPQSGAGQGASSAKPTTPQSANATQPSQLVVAASSELRNLRADLDGLISRIPHLAESELNAAKILLLQKYGAGTKTVTAVTTVARETITHGMEVAGDYVKDRPLKTVAVTAGIGMLIGMLIGRSR